MRQTSLKIGQVHGHITLLEKLETKDKHHAFLWKCSCVCGNDKIVPSSKVRCGRSCGCINRKTQDAKSLVGEIFGKLTAIERLDQTDKYRCRYYRCKCDCGNEKIVSSRLLQHKAGTRSCGCLGRTKLPSGEAAFNGLYASYKISAGYRKFSFSLSKKQFKVLTQGQCKYCGLGPKQTTSNKNTNGTYIYNGIDRVNPTLGYSTKNCVSCCAKCNRMKSDMSKSDFLQHVLAITAWTQSEES